MGDLKWMRLLKGLQRIVTNMIVSETKAIYSPVGAIRSAFMSNTGSQSVYGMPLEMYLS